MKNYYSNLQQNVDYFNHLELVPDNVRLILDNASIASDGNDLTTEQCQEFKEELEQLGWTVDYDLAGVLSMLQPMEFEYAPHNLYAIVDPAEVVTIIRKHYNTWECDHSEEHQVQLINVLRELVDTRLSVPVVNDAIAKVSMGIEFDEYCMGLIEHVDLTDLEELHTSVNCLAAHYLANEIAKNLLNGFAPALIDCITGSIENTKFAIKVD